MASARDTVRLTGRRRHRQALIHEGIADVVVALNRARIDPAVRHLGRAT
jgi:hypothetical protein